MSGFLEHDLVTPPWDDDVANDFRVVKYTTDTTHKVDAIPRFFYGHYVSLYSPVETDFAFSRHSDAEVNRSVVATDEGATDKVGGKILAGERRDVLIPPAPKDGSAWYFVRESASLSTVTMELASR